MQIYYLHCRRIESRHNLECRSVPIEGVIEHDLWTVVGYTVCCLEHFSVALCLNVHHKCYVCSAVVQLSSYPVAGFIVLFAWIFE